ncbi:hypothetical protein CY0110_16017 [Crocosphaera chwakensis CCY0110]|uniref:Uncharacterized protein n=1 Tax=Crocosphaera chwakensis CCY0110 TaxID=391612 RepID=A3IHN5_9CHRO|nr:hypothetical protein CY0110_16017 [Crocosphaera chwakensis CCY0110]
MKKPFKPLASLVLPLILSNLSITMSSSKHCKKGAEGYAELEGGRSGKAGGRSLVNCVTLSQPEFDRR